MTLADTAAPLVTDVVRPRPARSIAVRTLSRRDLHAALAAGWADFRAAPTQNVFLCALYPLVAILLARAASGGTLLPLLYPAASGFALMGPIAAVGLFEISRRRERGEAVRATDAFRVLREPGFGAIAVLGLGLLLLFVVWMLVSEALLGATVGAAASRDPAEFMGTMIGTGGGIVLILLGNAAGFLFALVVLVTATFSIPLALDRATPPLAAILASIEVFRRNAPIMMLWGLLVALILLLGSIPAFIGLAVALPVLGHATWHLYRRAIAPERAGD